jgi:hypothetical protein
METTRKAWRNREVSAGEGVLALLEALREALSAQAVGLFDDDRGDPTGQSTPPSFWEAFDEPPCAEIDWARWYQALRRDGRVETTCGCGAAHHLRGFLIHGRWALLLVAPPALSPHAAAAIASSVRALAARLPPSRPAILDDEAPPSPPRPQASGGLLWWVRKARQ